MLARAAPAFDAPHIARALGASARRSRRHGRRTTRITTPRAVSDGEASNDTEASTSAPAKVGRFVKRDASDTREVQAPLGAGPGDVGARGSAPPAMNIKVIPLGETKFQGVAKPAVAETESEIVFRRAQLVGGDVLALVVFAAIGRGNHGEGLFVSDVLATAAPFAAGWFGAMGVGDTFGAKARGDEPGEAAVCAAKSWAVGIPAGLALRAIGKGALPPGPFVVVSMAVTGAFLVGWRYWFAEQKAVANGTMVGGNKRGNPLEFMNLLFGLVKRW